MKLGACAWLLVSLGAVAFQAAADEVILRDGKKLSGTITGFENGVYRLETDFGTALIKKERIARIEFGGAEEKGSGAARPPEKEGARTSGAEPRATAAPLRPARGSATAAPVIRERRPPGGRVLERVEGSTYINDSFGFQMFKPPTWQVFEQAARDIPSAVAMLGTPDETTLFVVGNVLYEGPPAAYARVLDNSLRQKYSEFVVEPEEQVRVAGLNAIRRSFRGMAGGQEWHGLVVNLADGAIHYGMIGVTRDEAFRFKAGVLTKIVSSFRFR